MPRVPATVDGRLESPLAAEVLERLSGDAPRRISCSPGRLDVMGGIAEYTGALVLGMTTGRHACVAVQPRTDGIIAITRCPRGAKDGDGAVKFSGRGLHGDLSDAERTETLGGDGAGETERCVLGVLVGTLREGLVSDWDDGVSVVVASSLSKLTDAGRNAAVAAGTLAALAHAREVAIEPRSAVRVCQRVQNEWLDAPVGASEAACTLLGKPQAVSQLQGEPCTLVGSIPLPEDLVLLGVDSGVTRADWKSKYARARTAAAMGRVLIERIIRYDGGGQVAWNGRLAGVSVEDFVERFRDRIPTKLKGSVFLERFGETGDSLTCVDPDLVYKVRSRTEHHVYEHARSCRFAECLSRFTRHRDRRILLQAGELMYASHWSYGQRCGLGTVETDLLVNLLRQPGPDAGIYGAKISGRGCGGVVTVLMEAGERAEAALQEALAAYEAKTGRSALAVRGSLPGSLVSGVQRM